jgi:hypothetical protein
VLSEERGVGIRRDLPMQPSVVAPDAGGTSWMGARGDVTRPDIPGSETLDARDANAEALSGFARAQAVAQRLDDGHAQLNRIRMHTYSMLPHPTFSDTLYSGFQCS